jgi:light-regulated signal transduction histidine kinase (bacteriophytochrome)
MQEEFNTVLDDELKRLLGIIQNNANRMGLLIDDLLAFSKLGRKDVLKTPVNTSEIVKQVLQDLKSTIKPETRIIIQQLLPAEADASLLRQVFVNLLSNAIKYSAKKQNPQIELNSFETEDEIIYLVKDNGAGFNMNYAQKLFGVFQRLHSDEEFEGTGVGLAIVQRVIVKHGGRVWAEGEMDKGATFYFSLPKPVTT